MQPKIDFFVQAFFIVSLNQGSIVEDFFSFLMIVRPDIRPKASREVGIVVLLGTPS